MKSGLFSIKNLIVGTNESGSYKSVIGKHKIDGQIDLSKSFCTVSTENTLYYMSEALSKWCMRNVFHHIVHNSTMQLIRDTFNLKECTSYLRELRKSLDAGEILDDQQLDDHVTNGARYKRGLINYGGRIQNWLWGTATEKQIEPLERQLNILVRRMNSSEDMITDGMAKMSSLIQISDELHNNDNTKFHKLYNITKLGFEALQKRLDNVFQTATEQQALSHHVVQCMTMTSIISNSLQIMTQITMTIDDFIMHYNDVRSLMGGKSFPFSLVSGKTMQKSLKSVESFLPKTLSVIKYQNIVSLLSSMQTYGTVFNNTIIILVDIPLVVNTDNIKLWTLNALPLYSSGRWIQTSLTYKYILMNTHSRIWTPLTETQYNLCESNNLNLCPPLLTWFDANMDLCEILFLTNNDRLIEVCYVKLFVPQTPVGIYMENIKPNMWLVSSAYDNTMATVRCYNQATNALQVTTMMVPKYSKIVVSSHCSVRLGSTLLIPEKIILGNTRLETPDNYEITEHNLHIDNLSIMLPKLLPDPISSHDIEFDWSLNDTLESPISLRSLLHHIEQNKTIFSDRVSKLRHIQNQIRSVVYSDSWYSTILGWIANTFSISGPVCVGIVMFVIIIYLVYTRVYQNPLMKYPVVAYTAAASVPTTYADPIATIGTNVSMPNFNNMTKTLSNLVNQHFIISHQIQVGSLIIMVIMCILSHWIIRKYINNQHFKTRLMLNYTPMNIDATHLQGENRLIYFYIKFQTLCGIPPVFKEVKIQLCTLPGLCKDWYLEYNNTKKPFFTHQRMFRWNSMSNLPIQWGLFCIKSRQYPLLDTCEQLPQRIVVHQDSLIQRSRTKTPKFWIALIPHVITKIQLESDKEINLLYSFEQIP